MIESEAIAIRSLFDEALARALTPFAERLSKLEEAQRVAQRNADDRGDKILRTAEKCADEAAACVQAVANLRAELGADQPDRPSLGERLENLERAIAGQGELLSQLYSHWIEVDPTLRPATRKSFHELQREEDQRTRTGGT
jgi:hypothetical protein